MSSLFQFHASAVAASGSFTLPFCEPIETAAASALPPGGGYGSARVENFRYREILSIREAYSFVTGSFSKKTGAYETSTTAVVTGFNLLDVVTADRMVARLTSQKMPGSSEVSILPTGSVFDNLRIAGKRVDAAECLETDLFADFSRSSDIAGERDEDEDAEARLKWLEPKRSRLDSHLTDVLLLNRDPHEIDEKLRRYFPHAGNRAYKPQRKLSTSLAPGLSGGTSHYTAIGHVISVKGFGVVRLAEFQIGESRRRLTMLSVDLGSPYEGTVDACYAESNGSIWG